MATADQEPSAFCAAACHTHNHCCHMAVVLVSNDSRSKQWYTLLISYGSLDSHEQHPVCFPLTAPQDTKPMYCVMIATSIATGNMQTTMMAWVQKSHLAWPASPQSCSQAGLKMYWQWRQTSLGPLPLHHLSHGTECPHPSIAQTSASDRHLASATVRQIPISQECMHLQSLYMWIQGMLKS